MLRIFFRHIQRVVFLIKKDIQKFFCMPFSAGTPDNRFSSICSNYKVNPKPLIYFLLFQLVVINVIEHFYRKAVGLV